MKIKRYGTGQGFPLGLEEAELAIQTMPSFPALDHPLEFGETFEGDRNGELNARSIKLLGDGLVEKRAVDTCLYFDSG